jgi:hypothetical protein
VADFNLDGRPDIVAGNQGTTSGFIYADGKVSVLLNEGGGGFRAPLVLPCGPSDRYAEPIVAAADFNGDGRPDVAAAGYFQRAFPDPSPANVRLLVNDGQWPSPPPEPLGPEFLVHAPSAAYQNYPDVAADAAGNFVVVWNSQSGAVFDPYAVYARRFGAGGQPLGDEFLVSQEDGGYYTTPAVAMDPHGDFVVAWRSQGGIVARLFDAAGRPRGAAFPVTSAAAGGENPDVAMDADGDFMVVWESEYQDGSQSGIYARRYSAAGTALGDDFRVNTFTQFSQESPTVAMDAAGNAVVAWMSSNQADSPFDIYAQLYDGSGARRGAEFRVNTITPGQQDYPSVAMDAAGNFVVAWDSWVPDDWSRVYARRYDSAGLPRSAEFRVGTSETGHELRPSAAFGAGGALTVAWLWMSGFVAPATMYARSYDASGAAGTEQLLVNPTVEGGGPVAAGPDGGFVATWWHQYSGGQGIDDDVYARVFSAAATPSPSAVLARHVFYNRSVFDGNDAGATVADDAAVATDKEALLRGQSPTFANVTSYAGGINGIMVDVAGLPAGAVLTAADFDFGTTAAPASVTIRRGAGVNGSDRVTLTWPDYNPAAGSAATQAVANGWLRVTVKANAQTGLSQPDVFSFGNLIGDSGDSESAPFRVNALDLGRVKQQLNHASDITGRVDFNRDGRVNALDLGIAKAGLNHSLAAATTGVAAASPPPFAVTTFLAGEGTARRVWDEPKPQFIT